VPQCAPPDPLPLIPPRSDTPPPQDTNQTTPMDLDDPPRPPLHDNDDVWSGEWWREAKDAAAERLMKKASHFGLRELKPTDRVPSEILDRIKEFGRNILIREGPPLCDKKKNDPLRSCFEYSLGVDPGMNTFLVCANSWTGDEFWIGFGQSDRINSFLDNISAIKSEISTEVEKDERVIHQVNVCHDMADILIESTSDADTQVAMEASKKATSDLLELKASITKEKTIPRQVDIDSLYTKIDHIQQKLHKISAEFLSHWDLVAIPRFGLHNMIKRGGGSELGDKQKAILTMLAHCKFLDRFRTTARKRGCDIVEVTEAGSTKNCSHCNSTNSPQFDRFYHCRNCKRKMTRDGNAAMNIFKMALSVILMRLKYKSNFPDLLYEVKDDDDGDEDDEESKDEMDWEEEKVLGKDEVDEWINKKRKRDEGDTCERGPLRKSNVLSSKRRAVRDQNNGFNSVLTQGYQSIAPF
jgi:hypothetical protein